MLIIALAAAPLTANAYPLKAPWRGDSLPAGHFLVTDFHHPSDYACKDDPTKQCAMDFKGRRFNGTAWTPYKVSSPTQLSDYVSWDMPVYSPVDGEIVACWRHMPDDLFGGDEPPECGDLYGYGDPPQGCMGGGNHVLIDTLDGHLVFIAHLRANSIDPALCPHSSSLTQPGQSTASDKPCLLKGLGYDGWRDVTMLSTPIPIFKGEKIGNVGNSGNSDAPHLHIDVREFVLDANDNICQAPVPWEFAESWYQEMVTGTNASNDLWEPLEAELPANTADKEYLVYADPQVPRVDDLDLEDGSSPALALTPSGGVTAFLNASGNLEAVGFKFDSNNDFDIGLGDEDVGVFGLDLARINDTQAHVVAAVQKSSDNKLRLVPYFVESDADLVLGNAVNTAHTVSLVNVTPAPTHSGVVVASKEGSNLVVRDYKTSIAGQIISLSTGGSASTSTTATHLDVATVVQGRGASENSGAWKGIVTAERSSGGAAVLRTFSVSSTGNTVSLVGSANVVDLDTNATFNTGGVELAVTGNLGGREYVVLSTIIASNNNLRVQTWEVSSTGQLDLVEQLDGGPVTHISAARVGYQDVMIGARLTGGSLTMLSFNVGSNGSLRRVGTNDAGGIMSLALDGRADQQDVVVAAPLSSNGEVRLIHYLTNYAWYL